MTEITMLELRQNSQAIIRDLKQGKEMTLTYRGQAVAKLMPVRKSKPVKNKQPKKSGIPHNSIFRLLEISGPGIETGQRLTNEEIDRIVYGV